MSVHQSPIITGGASAPLPSQPVRPYSEDLNLLGHVGGEAGVSYHRDRRDGAIWRECWGHWSRMTPGEAAADILDWPAGYREHVDAAPEDAEWANIERRRIEARERLARIVEGGAM